ncbi:MAG: sigma 54-interacting transcriptional regulator [Myxococcales bacterium]|jgi:PAS domain S-box-containing protein|nr:sigma 54-interacting transcriptional regulator [Myxococcales bacterium]
MSTSNPRQPPRKTKPTSTSQAAGDAGERSGNPAPVTDANRGNPAALTSTDIILESISDGVFTVDGDWRIRTFNRAAEQITGVPREEAIGRYCYEVFRSSMCERHCALKQTMETGEPLVNQAAFIITADGRRLPIGLSTALLRDDRGRIAGGAETFRDLSLVENLRAQVRGHVQVGDLASHSPAMAQLLEVLPRIAASESTILIQGETGTGKELVARAIHDLSPRRDGPFVAVNCGALPDTLLESELFGHRAGAFTGAVRDKPGRFALARGGTLFLDEIGEVSPALQVRLLRVLQEKQYEPLGATQSERADVRVVAATHRDLEAQVAKGDFRSDLFYRIHVMPLELPPLRQRREDIPGLVDQFIADFNALQNKRVIGLRPDALALLQAHDYPGNVRELRNIIEHAFLLCTGDHIEVAHLPAALLGTAPAPDAATTDSPTPGAPPSLREAAAQLSADAILSALAAHDGNRTAAARALGIHKSTLFRKVRALGLSLPAKDGRSQRTPP